MTTKTALQPPPSTKWINPDGTPSLAFFQYMKLLDTLIGGLANGSVIGPLGNIGASGSLAANDAAAAALTPSVPVGGLYRDSVGVVHIRTA